MPIVHVNVKILNEARECAVSIDNKNDVTKLKQLIAEQFYIPINEQKLVLDGKTLTDDQSLEIQNVKDSCRLHLMVKKSPSNVRFTEEFNKFLRPHFAEPDCRRISDRFDAQTAQLANGVNWDDLERYAAWKLQNP